MRAGPKWPKLRDVIDGPVRRDGILITLLYEITAKPSNGGKHLQIRISDEGPAIVDGKGKRELFRSVADVSRDPIERWKTDAETGKSARYASGDLPLRWASGGVLPIIDHRGAEYFALSFRNIFPEGWNLFIGHAGDWDDLVDVERIVEREFREELLIWNKTGDVTYSFDLPGQLFDPSDSQQEGLARWGLGGCRREELACEIVRGPDKITVYPERDGNRLPPHTTEGLFVVIDSRALGIECVRIVRIPVPDELDLERDIVFLDGELHNGGLLDSPIGLVEVSKYFRWRRGGEKGDLPFVHVYQGGKHLAAGLSGSERIKDAWDHRNTLCPVTEGILQQPF